MSAIRLFPLFAGILFVTRPVWANEQADCAANAGTLLVGTVASGPTFARGHERRGVELSHTHVRLRGDDGRSYDIAIDNIFAEGYDQAGEHVPAPLSDIAHGERLEFCGKPYTSGAGMDWVHSNCGDNPTPADPNGWLKVVGADGSVGTNLEASQEYADCGRGTEAIASCGNRSDGGVAIVA